MASGGGYAYPTASNHMITLMDDPDNLPLNGAGSPGPEPLGPQLSTRIDTRLITTSPYITDFNSTKFPYPVTFTVLLWALTGLVYLFCRWRQRAKAIYIIPRVFVLCSPRTVQFHYELILRVGLPSADYNPDKHDIDVTVQGAQRNEVVPMTRLNTKTLLDEPLITSLSIIVYRLVEMPHLGSLVLRHSGPFKAWLYVYDFTVIDLTTNKEQYYTINKYIGQLNRVYALEEHGDTDKVHYPIDDVPLPPWSLEDAFLVVFAVGNAIVLSLTLMPIGCSESFLYDFLAVLLASINAGALLFFLEWLLHYYARWNSERREYFNLNETSTGSCCCCAFEGMARILVAVATVILGALTIFFGLRITHWQDSLIWLLAVLNTLTLVIGGWNVARMLQFTDMVVGLGLKFRGIETLQVGMRYSEIISDIQTKSGSTSDDGHSSTLSSAPSNFARSIGPRSSVKSFGFDPVTGHPSRRTVSRLATSRVSTTGATPDQQLIAQIRKLIK